MEKMQWHFKSSICWWRWKCKSEDLSFSHFQLCHQRSLLKCHIIKVTFGGRAEIENVKNDQPSDFQSHLRKQVPLQKSHYTFYICGALGKKVFCRILKRWFIGWIIAKMSRGYRFLLLWHHSYEVTLTQMLLQYIRQMFTIVKWDKGKTFTEWIKVWNFQEIFIRGLKRIQGGCRSERSTWPKDIPYCYHTNYGALIRPVNILWKNDPIPPHYQ